MAASASRMAKEPSTDRRLLLLMPGGKREWLAVAPGQVPIMVDDPRVARGEGPIGATEGTAEAGAAAGEAGCRADPGWAQHESPNPHYTANRGQDPPSGWQWGCFHPSLCAGGMGSRPLSPLSEAVGRDPSDFSPRVEFRHR